MNDSPPRESPRRVTIVQILPELESGGVERGTLEINQALVARGHRSIVVSAGGRLVKSLEAAGGEHVPLDVGKKSPLTLVKAFALRRILIDQCVDLVHVRSRMPAWVALLAWKRIPADKRPRFVTTVHGLNSINWYSKVMTYGERVITVSDCCREYTLRNYPATDPAKVITIHRGVSSEEFPFGNKPDAKWLAEWEGQYPQLKGRFVVLLPGRLTRFKGHFDFLQAIAKTKLAGIPVYGLIVGGVDPRRKAYAESVYAEVERLALSNDVTFTGHRSDLREIMCVSDVVVSTSIQPPESFGRTVLESVKLGRPTLGYDHGGVGEVLGKIYPQGRVPLQDTDTMAEKLGAVYRADLAPPGPTNEFDLPALLAKEIDLYEALVAESRPHI
jgi:glycosyltransferase involved in cell wall biosynthesis